MLKKSLAAAAITSAVFSINAHAGSYGGVDVMMMEVGSVSNTMLSATFGQTFAPGWSAEMKLAFGLGGGEFDNYNDYESIVDSDKLLQTTQSNGVITSQLEVENIFGVYARYNTMISSGLGASVYGGISQYTINLSSDFITSAQEDVVGPEVGASLFYVMDSGPTIFGELSKYKDFYDASVVSYSVGFRTTF